MNMELDRREKEALEAEARLQSIGAIGRCHTTGVKHVYSLPFAGQSWDAAILLCDKTLKAGAWFVGWND